MTFADTIRVVCLLAFALLVPISADADDNHYQNFLIGERATGLGGAYTAIADDASGGFYNPAGLAESPYSSLSLSSAIYGFASTSAAIDALNFESDNRSFVSYPTTAAWIHQVRKGAADGSGRVQLALSIITPQSDVQRVRYLVDSPWEPSGVAGQFQQATSLSTIASEDETLWVGFSAAWKIHRRIAVGATLFGSRRTGLYQLHQHALVRLADQTTQQENGRVGLATRVDATFSHYGLIGVLGALVTITEHLKLGASFRSPTIELHGAADFGAISTTRDPQSGAFSLLVLDVKDAKFRDRQPFKGTLGLAYIVPRRFGASLDFSLYGPAGEYAIFEDEADPTLAQDLRMKKRMVWQLNVGGEYYILGFVPIRLGFFTNLSSLASFNTCDSAGECGEHGNLMTDNIDMYGLSGAVGYEMEKATLTLGASYAFGSRSEELPGLTLDASRSYLFITLGGSFRF